MKINEITNATDILALWKLISDNTWAAVQQQADQQAHDRAEQAAKSIKGKKRGGVRRSAPRAAPKPMPPAVPVMPQAKPADVAPVQQSTVAQGALPSKGPWGAEQVPVAPYGPLLGKAP
jgi:hypothetical protein